VIRCCYLYLMLECDAVEILLRNLGVVCMLYMISWITREAAWLSSAMFGVRLCVVMLTYNAQG
jgi:hypothetical protein